MVDAQQLEVLQVLQVLFTSWTAVFICGISLNQMNVMGYIAIAELESKFGVKRNDTCRAFGKHVFYFTDIQHACPMALHDGNCNDVPYNIQGAQPRTLSRATAKGAS